MWMRGRIDGCMDRGRGVEVGFGGGGGVMDVG
jgi:hypothetical protein